MDFFNDFSGLTENAKDTLSLALYLLPGLITYFTYRYSKTLRKHTNFEVILLSFFFSVSDLLIFGIIRSIPKGPEWLDSIYVLYGIAFVLGVLVAFIENKDIVLWILRKFRITNKTNRLSVWEDTQNYSDTYVRVFATDGTMYEGFVRYYSETIDPLEIFLTDVIVYTVNDDYTFEEKEEIGGIYINNRDIKYVQFEKVPEKDKPKIIDETK